VTATPAIGVLALQGDVREHLGALTACGARAVAVRRRSELDAVDGIVLPGGESTTIEKLLRIFGLFEPLQERIRGGMPAYGSCAGMILLARRVLDGAEGQQSLGVLDVTVRRNAFGRQVDSFEEAVDFPALGPVPFPAVFIRAPWVESVGPEVEVMAVVAGSDHDRIVAVRAGNLLATSFHPELTGDHRVHGLFVDLVRAA
jgi:5'-phosphate synthase pdxT subunit